MRPQPRTVWTPAVPLPPTELAADADVKNFDLRGDARKLFEDVAHAYGLDCMFDGDYQPVPPFRFQMDEVDYRVALHGLESGDLFVHRPAHGASSSWSPATRPRSAPNSSPTSRSQSTFPRP